LNFISNVNQSIAHIIYLLSTHIINYLSMLISSIYYLLISIYHLSYCQSTYHLFIYSYLSSIYHLSIIYLIYSYVNLSTLISSINYQLSYTLFSYTLCSYHKLLIYLSIYAHITISKSLMAYLQSIKVENPERGKNQRLLWNS